MTQRWREIDRDSRFRLSSRYDGLATRKPSGESYKPDRSQGLREMSGTGSSNPVPSGGESAANLPPSRETVPKSAARSYSRKGCGAPAGSGT
jgi:hypothetical protein